MPLSSKSACVAIFIAAFSHAALFGQADFSLTANPGSQTVWQAQSTSYLITVNPINGFTGAVTFSASGLPAGATASFSPNPITGSGTTTMTVTASPGTPTGSSTLTVTGTSTPTRTTTVSLNVVVPPPITYTYDAVGRLTSVTDQFGQSAFYRYDSVGNLISITRSDINTVTIQAFAPASGLPGSTVTILGSGFSTTPGNNTVKFNGVPATVTSSSGTEIVTTVPAGATTGPISVTVGANTQTSNSSFTVIPPAAPPSISSFTPTAAPVSSQVIITGTNFATTPAGNIVKIGPTVLSLLSATSTSITAILPNIVGSGKISVQTASGLATSASDFIILPSPFRSSDVTLFTRSNVGTTFSTKFNASGEAAVVIFDGTQGQKVRFLANCSKDDKLVVFNPDGTVLMSDTAITTSGSIIETPPLPADGTYTLLVKGPISTSVFPTQWGVDLGRTTINIVSSPSPSDFTVTSQAEFFSNYFSTAPYYQPNYKSGQRFKIFVSMGSSLSVNLSVSGLPAGVTASLSAASVSSSAIPTLEFTVADTVSAGTYPVTVTGTAGALARSTTVQLGVNPPPSPWKQVALGGVGRTEYSSGTYTGVGSFHFTYQDLPANVDASLVVRVAGMSYERIPAFAGVMVREALTDPANNMFLQLQTDGSVVLQTTTSGGSLNSTILQGITAPFWFKIARQGSTITSFYSQTGSVWTQAGSPITLTTNAAFIGLANGSGSFFILAETVYDNVSLNLGLPDFLLTASPASVTVQPGNAATYTVNVAPMAGFSGQVNLTIPPASLPSGATAAFNPQTLTSGNSTLTVTTAAGTPLGNFTLPITGSDGVTTRTATVALQTGPDFTLSVSPTSQTSNISTSVTYTVTATFLNGLTTPVLLTAAGIPTGTTASFSPSSLSATGSSTLTLNIGANTPQRTYGFTIVGKSGTINVITHTLNANLTVGTSDFSVVLDAPGISYPATGGVGTRTITIAPVNGFTKTVTLSATGLPTGATASFNPQSISPAGSSILTITLPGGMATGNYSATIVGTVLDQAAGNPARSTPLTLVVNPSGALPSGWSSQDIGTVGIPGVTAYNNGVFTVQASGTGFNSSSDSGHFAYQSWTGDASLVVKLSTITNFNTSADYGLMIRESLAANGRMAFIRFENNAAGFGARTSSPGSVNWSYANNSLYGERWLKLVRSGDTISGYVSIDGVSWGLAIGTAVFSGPSLAASIFVGVAVEAGSNSTTTTADFYNPAILNNAGDFYLVPVTSSQVLPQGAASTYHTIRVGSINGFTGSVNMSLSLPPGGSYAPQTITVPAGSYTNLQIDLPSGLAPGPYTAVITGTSGSLTHTAPITLTVSSAATLGAPWNSANIGSVQNTGSSSLSNGTFTITTTSGFIRGTSDNFRYTYRSLNGDGAMILRVTDFGHYIEGVRKGIMMRETLEPDSPYVMAHILGWFPGFFGQLNGNFEYRSTKGGNSTETTGPVVAPGPFWLKLIRQGNDFKGFSSTDGASWAQIGSTITVPMAARIFVGIATGSAGDTTTATFDNGSAFTAPDAGADFWIYAHPAAQALGTAGGNVYYTAEVGALNGFTGTVNLSMSGLPAGSTGTTASVAAGATGSLKVSTPSLAALPYPMTINGVSGALTRSFPVTLNVSNPGPSRMPDPWAQIDIGTVAIAGDGSFSNGAYSVSGSGNPLYYKADNFHFVYQPLSGTNATLIARVASTQNLSGTAKAGIMIRETLTSASPHAYVANQASNLGLFQYRAAPGGDSAYNYPEPPGQPWLKLVRSGNNFSGFQSADGVTWSQLGSTQTIPMGATAYVGFAVASESNTVATTAAFDNFQLATGSDFRLSPSPASRTVAPATSTTYTINVDALNGFAGPVTFSVSGLPSGATSSFSPTSWAGTGTVTMTVTPAAGTPNASYPLTITGTGAGLTRTTQVTLNVGGFTITPTPASQTAYLSNSVSYTVTIASVAGFSSVVSLSASGNPARTTMSISPASVTPPANGTVTATLTVTTQSNTSAGTWPLTITGVSGGYTQTASVSFTVSTTPTYTLSVSPATQLINASASAAYTVTVQRYNGFTSAVNMVSVTGLPSGATGSFNPTTVASGSTQSTLTVATTRTTTVGSSTFTVNGDSSGTARSSTAVLQVDPPPDFALTPSPNSRTVAAGTSAVYTINVTPSQFFNGAVSLTASGLPANAVATFNPASLATGSGQSALTITTTNVAAGTSTITVTGATGSGPGQFSHSVNLSLTVGNAADFAITGTAVQNFAAAGQTATFTLAVEPANGFTGAVSFTVSGLPTGTSPSFSPNPVNGSGTTTLSLPVTAVATPGAYSLTITGTSGSLSHTYAATLVVIDKDFSIALTPQPVSMVVQKDYGTIIRPNITPSGGFNTPVLLSVSGLPSCATYTVASNPAPQSAYTGNAVYVYSTNCLPATVGIYTVTVTGTAGNGLTHSATTTLYVTDYTLSSNPTTQTISRGGSANYQIVMNKINQYSESSSYYDNNVTYSISGTLPSRVTASFSPNPNNTGTTLTLSTANNVTAGTYQITVQSAPYLQGTTPKRYVTVTLVINP